MVHHLSMDLCPLIRCPKEKKVQFVPLSSIAFHTIEMKIELKIFLMLKKNFKNKNEN